MAQPRDDSGSSSMKVKPEPIEILDSDDDEANLRPVKRLHMPDSSPDANESAGSPATWRVGKPSSNVLLPVADVVHHGVGSAGAAQQCSSPSAARVKLEHEPQAADRVNNEAAHSPVENASPYAAPPSATKRKGGQEVAFDRSTAEMLSNLNKRSLPPRADSSRNLSDHSDSHHDDSMKEELQQGEDEEADRGGGGLLLGGQSCGALHNAVPHKNSSDLQHPTGTPLDPESDLAVQALVAACLGENRCKNVLGMRMSGHMAIGWQLMVDYMIHNHKQTHKHSKKSKRDDEYAYNEVVKQLMELIVPNTNTLLTMLETDAGKSLLDLQATDEAQARRTLLDCSQHIKNQLAEMIVECVADALGKEQHEVTLIDVLENMPEDLPVNSALRRYEVGQEDQRTALQGEYGVLVTAHVNPCTVLGPYAGFYMLPDEYDTFQVRSPFSLLCSLLDTLKQLKEEDVQLPGELTGPLASLLYQQEPATADDEGATGLSLDVVRCLLSCCTILQLQSIPAGRGRPRKNREVLYAVAPRAQLVAGIQELVVRELTKVAIHHGLEVPVDLDFDAPELKEEFKAWRKLSEAEWVLTCDSYGADISTDQLGEDGQTHLVDVLRTAQEVVWKGRKGDRKNSLEGTALQRFANRNDLTASAIFMHQNEMAYINDPAVELPKDEEACKSYQEQSSHANCFLLVVQIAHWPFPFLITRRDLQPHDSCSYSYDQPYWKVVFEKMESMQLHKKIVQLSIQLRQERREKAELAGLSMVPVPSLDAQRSTDPYHVTGTSLPARHLSCNLDGHPSGTASAHVNTRQPHYGQAGDAAGLGRCHDALLPQPSSPTSPAPRHDNGAHSDQDALSTPHTTQHLPRGDHVMPAAANGAQSSPSMYAHHHARHPAPSQGMPNGYHHGGYTYSSPARQPTYPQGQPTHSHLPSPSQVQPGALVPYNPGYAHGQMAMSAGCGWDQQQGWAQSYAPQYVGPHAGNVAVDMRAPTPAELLDQLFN